MSRLWLPPFFERVNWMLRRRLATPAMRRHIVFRDGGSKQEIAAEDASIMTLRNIDSLEDFPGYNRLCEAAAARETLANGGTIRLIIEEGEIAALAFHAHLQAWYVPLAEADQVIYSVVTRRSAMGRGHAGRLVRRIARDVADAGGTAWLDCAGWNTRAHRAFMRAGFVRHNDSTYPPIPNRIRTAI